MFSDNYMIISKHYQAYLKSRRKPKIAFQTAFLSIAWIFCFCLSRHWLKRCKTYQMTYRRIGGFPSLSFGPLPKIT